VSTFSLFAATSRLRHAEVAHVLASARADFVFIKGPALAHWLGMG
jgi:hypothetical protein